MVRPGIFPARRIAAPNSPTARANAKMIPALIARAAKGSVTVKKIRRLPAPRVKAISSRWTSTPSKPTGGAHQKRKRHHRCRDHHGAPGENGIEMNVWKRNAPIGPRRPKSFSRSNPVATGGITRGKVSNVSTTVLPRQRLRASNQARTRPKGKISNVLRAHVPRVKTITRHSLASSRVTSQCRSRVFQKLAQPRPISEIQESVQHQPDARNLPISPSDKQFSGQLAGI